MQEIIMIARGMLMGIAELVPSVGGSTIALVLGIYDDFIDFLSQISDFIKVFLKLLLRRSTYLDLKNSFKKINFKFGILSFLGIAISLAFFSKTISELLHDYPVHMYSFFFGLVIASATIPWGEMQKRGSKELLIVIITFITFFLVLGIKPEVTENPTPIFLFVTSALAISAIVLPGISISFVFLLFGVYDFVIALIRDLLSLSINADQLFDIFIIGVGAIFGFLSFVKLIKSGLEKYPSELMGLSVGLMLASLRVLWPFFEEGDNEKKLLPWEVSPDKFFGILLLVAIAIILIFALKFVAKTSNINDLE